MTDLRSALAVKVIDANPRAYEKLVVQDETSPLARTLLDGVTPDQILAVPVKDSVAAQAMLGALWLWHDALGPAHEIVQKSPRELLGVKSRLTVLTGDSATSSDAAETLAFWHAILHRREGDFSNSKYWYARCENHAALTTLGVQAARLINAMPADKSLLKLGMSGWNPNAFVDLVQTIHDKPDDSRYGLAVALQKLEWQILFDHCARASYHPAHGPG